MACLGHIRFIHNIVPIQVFDLTKHLRTEHSDCVKNQYFIRKERLPQLELQSSRCNDLEQP